MNTNYFGLKRNIFLGKSEEISIKDNFMKYLSFD
tara:strand:+ start:1076 stop:1177 length:102 start_codon:yes stop_codon:yes gene_type:complete